MPTHYQMPRRTAEAILGELEFMNDCLREALRLVEDGEVNQAFWRVTMALDSKYQVIEIFPDIPLGNNESFRLRHLYWLISGILDVVGDIWVFVNRRVSGLPPHPRLPPPDELIRRLDQLLAELEQMVALPWLDPNCKTLLEQFRNDIRRYRDFAASPPSGVTYDRNSAECRALHESWRRFIRCISLGGDIDLLVAFELLREIDLRLESGVDFYREIRATPGLIEMIEDQIRAAEFRKRQLEDLIRGRPLRLEDLNQGPDEYTPGEGAGPNGWYDPYPPGVEDLPPIPPDHV